MSRPETIVATCTLCEGELPMVVASEAAAVKAIMAAGWRVVHLEPRFVGTRSNPLICGKCAERFNVGAET